MIILPSTTDKLQVVTGFAGDIDVIVSYGEVTQATPPVVKPFDRQLTTIATAATTDVLGAPAASTTRTPEEMTIRNTHASVVNTILVQYNANGTIYELHKVTLAPGEMLEYIRGIGWFTVANGSVPLRNQNTVDVVANAADTYLTGSELKIPANRPMAIGTRFHWRLAATKTAAGVAGWVVNLRFGTLGTTGDTARLVFTQTTDVQTAAVDTGTWEIRAIVRGPISASCIVAGAMEFQHHLAVTGFSTVSGADAYQVTSSAFDITTAGMIVGLSCNPGAAGVFTFQVISAESENL